MQGPNPWCALKVPPAWRCGPARGRAALLTLTALTAKHCVVGSTGRARPDCSLRRSSRAQPTSPASPEREPTQPLHRLRSVPAYVAIEHQIKDLGRDLDDKDRELRELRRAAGRAESECSRIAADLTSARAEAAALAEQVAAAEAARAAADARLAQVQEARAPGWAAVMTAGSVGLAGYMEWGVKSLLPAVVHAVYNAPRHPTTGLPSLQHALTVLVAFVVLFFGSTLQAAVVDHLGRKQPTPPPLPSPLPHQPLALSPAPAPRPFFSRSLDLHSRTSGRAPRQRPRNRHARAGPLFAPSRLLPGALPVHPSGSQANTCLYCRDRSTRPHDD